MLGGLGSVASTSRPVRPVARPAWRYVGPGAPLLGGASGWDPGRRSPGASRGTREAAVLAPGVLKLLRWGANCRPASPHARVRLLPAPSQPVS